MPTPSNRMREAPVNGPGYGPVVDITGSAQTFDPPGCLHVDVAGTVTGKLVGDTSDHTWTFTVGAQPYVFKSITSVGGGFAGKIVR